MPYQAFHFAQRFSITPRRDLGIHQLANFVVFSLKTQAQQLYLHTAWKLRLVLGNIEMKEIPRLVRIR